MSSQPSALVRAHQFRLKNLTGFVSWVADNGPLRDGLSIEDAAATVWVITGLNSHRQMVDGLGWSHEQYRDWIRSTLEAALLPPAE